MTAPGVPFKRRCAFEPGCDGTPLPDDLSCGRHPACAECGGRMMHEIGCRTARAGRLAALAAERAAEAVQQRAAEVAVIEAARVWRVARRDRMGGMTFHHACKALDDAVAVLAGDDLGREPLAPPTDAELEYGRNVVRDAVAYNEALRVRADERARISRGLSAMADDEARRPGRRDCCSRSIETWLGEAAAFAGADPLASGEPVADRREDLAGDDEARSA